jgi:HTH-type transcriptional regulator, sugar sensing transcriptional regulator
MIISKEFLKKLRSAFNLNEYEVKIWAALLSKGISSAGELAEISGVPRSRSYDILESLEKRGFVIIKIGKPIKYIAVGPKAVLNRIKRDVKINADQKIKYVSNINNEDFFKEINLLYKNKIEHVDPTSLSGLIQSRKNLYSKIETMLNSAKKSVVITTSEDGLKRKLDIFKPILKKLSKKGVKIKIVAPVNSDPEVTKFANLKELGGFDGRFVLIDDKEILFMLTKDDVHHKFDNGIWINSPYFVNALSNMFDVAWKNN